MPPPRKHARTRHARAHRPPPRTRHAAPRPPHKQRRETATRERATRPAAGRSSPPSPRTPPRVREPGVVGACRLVHAHAPQGLLSAMMSMVGSLGGIAGPIWMGFAAHVPSTSAAVRSAAPSLARSRSRCGVSACLRCCALAPRRAADCRRCPPHTSGGPSRPMREGTVTTLGDGSAAPACVCVCACAALRKSRRRVLWRTSCSSVRGARGRP